MADTPPKVKITERLVNLDTYKKYAVYVVITIAAVLLIVGGVSLWRWVFKPKDTQVYKPTGIGLAIGHVEKGAVVQESTQISVEKERPWEVGLGAGGINYDNKSGVVVGGWVKRKF